MQALKLSLIAAFLAQPAVAQDVTRPLEMPGHRALMAARTTAELTPFATDGCSGGLSSSWQLVADKFPDFAAIHQDRPPWESCCITHDRAYHNAGGARQADGSYDARLHADEELRLCVISSADIRKDELATLYDVTPQAVQSAYETIAAAMYLAVRFGGGPCSGLPWRWGFGYPSCTPFDRVAPAPE